LQKFGKENSWEQKRDGDFLPLTRLRLKKDVWKRIRKIGKSGNEKTTVFVKDTLQI
jgi:hypothetical protein